MDIITQIKQKEGTSIDHMRDVVQYCLDKNPQITWITVITAAMSANEVAVARHILDKHSGKVDIN